MSVHREKQKEHTHVIKSISETIVLVGLLLLFVGFPVMMNAQIGNESLIVFENLRTLSPDGQYVAYVTAHNVGMVGSIIWIANADGSGAKQLVIGKEAFWVTNPIWSSDSKTIVYLKVIETEETQYDVTYKYELWTISVDGSHHRLLTDTSLLRPTLGYGGKADIAWNDQGEVIFYSHQTYPPQGYAIHFDTGEIRSLPVSTSKYKFSAQPIDVPYFHQCNSLWGSNRLGVGMCTYTICRAGCAMSSVSMLLKYFGADVDPGRLNTWLQDNGGYINCSIKWGTAASYYPGVTFVDSIYTSDKTRVRQELDAGYPVIVGVNDNGHYVVVTSYSGDTYYINDPGSYNRPTLASYGNAIGRIVIYHGPIQTPGCTDPNATNYDPNATVDDGSCEYLSFNEYPGIPANISPSQLTNHYYYSWMNSTAGNYTWTMLANPSATETAHVTIKLAGTVVGTYSVNPGEITYPRLDGQQGGSIEVESDVNIFTTQRTLLVDGGFGEYAGIPANNLTNHYYYSYMDSTAGNYTWTMLANPSATETAHITIKLAGTVVGTYSVNPGEIVYPRLDGQKGGPIEVTSDINIFTTQRTLIGVGFSEYAGIPANNLTNHYYYSWMDSTAGNYTWTMLANPSATEIAHVTIKLAGTVVGTYSLNPGEIVSPRLDGQKGGAIEVTSDINILTTQRAQTKISNASSAKTFMKEAQLRSSEFKYQQGLSNHFYYSWMDSTGAGKFYTWTMIANPSATAIAHVTIKLAGTVVGTYSLNPGEIAYPRLDGQQGGPIEVSSDINIFTTQRTLVNSAFSEYAGIPATSQEENSYLLWTK